MQREAPIAATTRTHGVGHQAAVERALCAPSIRQASNVLLTFTRRTEAFATSAARMTAVPDSQHALTTLSSRSIFPRAARRPSPNSLRSHPRSGRSRPPGAGHKPPCATCEIRSLTKRRPTGVQASHLSRPCRYGLFDLHEVY